MDYVELLTVKDSFQLTGKGVVVLPDFPVPNNWENREEEVVIQTVSMEKFKAVAQLNKTHFQIANPKVPAEYRWRVTVTFQNLRKEELSPGSTILASRQLCALLRSSIPNSSIE